MKATAFENPVAERSLIGSLILEPRRLDDIPALKPEHFREDILGKMFGMLSEMRAANMPSDIASLFTEMETRGLGGQLHGGSYPFLEELMNSVPVAYHAEYHAKTVFACWRRRECRTAIESLSNTLADPQETLDDVLAACDAKLRAVEDAGQSQAITPIGDMLADVLDDKIRTKSGLETGFAELDTMTTGLHGGQLVIIAARPGIGKSAYVGNIATNLAERGDGVLFTSLEMSRADLIYRLVARLSGLKLWQIRSPDMQYHEPILNAMNLMNRWPLYIDDTVPQTVAQIGAKARGLVRRGKIKLVIVDYLQLLQPSDKRAPREQQVSAMTRDLKCLAKQLKIPIIALSQLNRDSAKAARRPILPDLRESGAIEQDADLVTFIHRSGTADATDEEIAEVIIAKQRQGPQGTIKMDWDGTKFLFREKEVGNKW